MHPGVYLRTTFRLVLSGFRNNFLITAVSIGIVGLILFIFTTFLCLALNVGKAINSWRGDMGLVVYLQPGISMPELKKIESLIQGREEVEKSKLITPQEAWKELSKRVGMGEELFRALGDNPLPAMFELKLKREFRELEISRSLAAFFSRIPGVEDVDYGQEWVERANRFFRLVENTLFGICLLLGLSSLFVIGNTIRLIIFNRREEVEILGLIGAPPGFIALPYLVEGFSQGFWGGILALGLAFLFYHFGIEPLFQTFGFFGDLELSFLSLRTCLLIIGGGGIIGLVGSGWSIKRYLPN